jgi:hypothetical protein
MFAEGSTSISQYAAHPGEQFRETLPYVLIAALVLVLVYLIAGLVRGRARDAKSRWTLWEKLVYLALLVSVSVLAVTSFGALLRLGEMSGWALFTHMVGAGMFTFTLPVLAITWCEPSRFDIRRVGERAETGPRRFYWFVKLTFWIVLLSGLIVSMSMLLSMLPLFGTEGLGDLLDLHRYSGLIVVIALVFHLVGVVLQRLGKR